MQLEKGIDLGTAYCAIVASTEGNQNENQDISAAYSEDMSVMKLQLRSLEW